MYGIYHAMESIGGKNCRQLPSLVDITFKLFSSQKAIYSPIFGSVLVLYAPIVKYII